MLKTLMARSLALFLLVFINLSCSEQRGGENSLSFNGLTMGTTYSIKINRENASLSGESLVTAVTEILEEINNKMSTYSEGSELSRLNRNTSADWISVSEDLYEVLAVSMEISALSAGSFDITIGPLVNLWGFGPPERQAGLPSHEQIQELLDRSGFQYLQLRSDPPAVKKTEEDLYLDLSAIAKGFAVDRIAEYLQEVGIDNYLVEIGGEIRARGVNEKGQSWRIGIEKPLIEGRKVERILRLENIAMATSGNYRNFFELDGVRYSHTINPVNGYPVSHSLVSVTVLHESASYADALATAFLVMGREKAMRMAESGKIAALFYETEYSGFSESFSTSLRAYLAD